MFIQGTHEAQRVANLQAIATKQNLDLIGALTAKRVLLYSIEMNRQTWVEKRTARKPRRLGKGGRATDSPLHSVFA